MNAQSNRYTCACGVTLLYTDRHLNCPGKPKELGDAAAQMTVRSRRPDDLVLLCPWHIVLSSTVTVVELAMLMSRLGCNAHLTGDELVLVPRNFTSPCPTNRQLAELFMKGASFLKEPPLTILSASPWLRTV